MAYSSLYISENSRAELEVCTFIAARERGNVVYEDSVIDTGGEVRVHEATGGDLFSYLP